MLSRYRNLLADESRQWLIRFTLAVGSSSVYQAFRIVMSRPQNYALAGELTGVERLGVLSRVFADISLKFLQRAELPNYFHAADLGCGIGSVTRLLAECYPNSTVVGFDADDFALSAAVSASEGLKSRVSYRKVDLLTWIESDSYGCVYTRFLLHHLPKPELLLKAAHRALHDDGTILIEDLHFSMHFCAPPSNAFARYIDLYLQAIKKKGGDADIGPRLPTLLQDAGFRVQMIQVVQPSAREGEMKQMALLTLNALANSIIEADICSSHDLQRTIYDLGKFTEDPTSIISLPRLFQIAAVKQRFSVNGALQLETNRHA